MEAFVPISSLIKEVHLPTVLSPNGSLRCLEYSHTEAGDCISEANVAALDVGLSHNKIMKVIQLATADACFILDVLGNNRSLPLVMWLPSSLPDPHVCKVIHDCLMDMLGNNRSSPCVDRLASSLPDPHV